MILILSLVIISLGVNTLIWGIILLSNTLQANENVSAAVSNENISGNNTNSLNNTLNALNKTLNALNKTGFQSNAQAAKQVFGDLPASMQSMLFAIAFLIGVPVILDLWYAHRRVSKQPSSGSTGPGSTNQETPRTSPAGMPGLYRGLMTFGVIIIVSAIVVYLIALIAFNISINSANVQALMDILKNLAAILGTALASVIAFYFGSRGAESAAEKARSGKG